MSAQMNLFPTRNDQMESEGLIWGTFTWGGNSDKFTLVSVPLGSQVPSEIASGLCSSTPQMIGFILLPLRVLLRALDLLQTYVLAFEKLLLRSEALLVRLGPALGRDKQARICFPDCNTGESGRSDSCSPTVPLVVPDKEEHGSCQHAALCACTYQQHSQAQCCFRVNC